MLPLLQLGPVSLPSYGFFVALGILASVLIRRIELQRLAYPSVVGQGWVGVGALVGAIVGSKLGMVLFVRPTELYALFLAMVDWNFEGKTVVGGLIGGYIGVEICKKIVGIRHSTGDAFAVAIPVAQALGRVGCFLHGCCWGIPTDHWPGLPLSGVLRHPTPLYESVLDLGLAAFLWGIRRYPRPSGYLFRYFLIGYACIRFTLEFWRGDVGWFLGPFTAVQWVCLCAALGFGGLCYRGAMVVGNSPHD